MTKADKRPPLRVDVTPAAAGPPVDLATWCRAYVRALLAHDPTMALPAADQRKAA